MRLLVTGGTGYIGSHTVHLLCQLGHDVTVLDNLAWGHREAVMARVVECELTERATVHDIVRDGHFDAVMHFAGYAIVGESGGNPSKYFYNNVGGSLNLLDALVAAGTTRIVFSSTSEVYGEAQHLPIAEEHPKQPTNPYGESKWMVEQMLRRYSDAYGLRSISLRYLNAAGAAEDGSLGEDHEPETHLIPNAIKAALGWSSFQLTCSSVNTPDGTTIRDYIHVLDLASAHVQAITALMDGAETTAYNVGLGHGYSTRSMIDAVQRATGTRFPLVEGRARAGEPAAKYASNDLIRRELGWQPSHDLDSIITTALRWHRSHPRGYRSRVMQSAV